MCGREAGQRLPEAGGGSGAAADGAGSSPERGSAGDRTVGTALQLRTHGVTLSESPLPVVSVTVYK